MWIADMLHFTIVLTVTLQSAVCTALSWTLKVMLVLYKEVWSLVLLCWMVNLSTSSILETIYNKMTLTILV